MINKRTKILNKLRIAYKGALHITQNRRMINTPEGSSFRNSVARLNESRFNATRCIANDTVAFASLSTRLCDRAGDNSSNTRGDLLVRIYI